MVAVLMCACGGDDIIPEQFAQQTDGGETARINTNIQTSTANTIEGVIIEKYPTARIVEIDRERNGFEVDIIHESIGKEVYLDTAYTWLRTEWDVRPTSLPTAVTAAITASYEGYRIDDADYLETPTGNYYLIELEQRGQQDTYLKIDEAGNILP
jgi:hypothetical protein